MARYLVSGNNKFDYAYCTDYLDNIDIECEMGRIQFIDYNLDDDIYDAFYKHYSNRANFKFYEGRDGDYVATKILYVKELTNGKYLDEIPTKTYYRWIDGSFVKKQGFVDLLKHTLEEL